MIAVLHFPDKRVAEIEGAIAVVTTAQAEERVFGPGLEIRTGSPHHYLTVLISSGFVALAGVVDIIQFLLLVIHDAAGTEGCVLLAGAAGR